MPLRRLTFISALIATLAAATPYSALRDGEAFRYRVGWGIFAHAGEITVSAQFIASPPPAICHLTAITTTRGLIQSFYSYEDRSEARIDLATGRLLHVTDKSTGAPPNIDASLEIDYTKREAFYRDALNPKRNRDLRIPEGDPIDLLSGMIQTRDWDLRIGDRRELLIQAGRDFYPVTITAERHETIKTRQGPKETTVLVPRMEREAPRGIFTNGGEIKVWVAQDEQRLPVRMQLRLSFGTATLHLEEYRPPSAGRAPSSPAVASAEPPVAPPPPVPPAP